MIYDNTISRGSILPVTIIFMVVGLSIIFAYFKWAQNRRYTLNYRIAKTKAYYNAESGLAEAVFRRLVNVNFTSVDTTFSGKWMDKIDDVKHKEHHLLMGRYRSVHLTQTSNEIGQMMLNGEWCCCCAAANKSCPSGEK